MLTTSEDEFTIDILGTRIRVNEAFMMYIEARHPDEMRRGRKRHRKRAAERFLRRMTDADRRRAMMNYTMYQAGMSALQDRLERDFLATMSRV